MRLYIAVFHPCMPCTASSLSVLLCYTQFSYPPFILATFPCCSRVLTFTDSENTTWTPKSIGNSAGVVSRDVFCLIIHYKCVLISGGPPVCHCLVSLVLHSINIQCVTILHPGDISSRWGCGGAGQGQVCGGAGMVETGNTGCSCTCKITNDRINRLPQEVLIRQIVDVKSELESGLQGVESDLQVEQHYPSRCAQ